MTARAQSRDKLVTWTIWPLGVVMTSPLTDRIRVTRRVTSSTVPVTCCDTPDTAMRTTSPNPYCRSPVMNNPAFFTEGGTRILRADFDRRELHLTGPTFDYEQVPAAYNTFRDSM